MFCGRLTQSNVVLARPDFEGFRRTPAHVHLIYKSIVRAVGHQYFHELSLSLRTMTVLGTCLVLFVVAISINCAAGRQQHMDDHKKDDVSMWEETIRFAYNMNVNKSFILGSSWSSQRTTSSRVHESSLPTYSDQSILYQVRFYILLNCKSRKMLVYYTQHTGHRTE